MNKYMLTIDKSIKGDYKKIMSYVKNLGLYEDTNKKTLNFIFGQGWTYIDDINIKIFKFTDPDIGEEQRMINMIRFEFSDSYVTMTYEFEWFIKLNLLFFDYKTDRWLRMR